MQKLMVVSRFLLTSPNNSISLVSADFCMPQNCLEQTVSKTIQITVKQKTTACDKHLSSQFVAQILEYGNSCVVFSDAASCDICGLLDQHNCVIWCSELSGEQLER
jgi:hypothetical protein